MIERPERGTEITLHLRDGQDDLLSAWKLKSIIRKYSDHIVQPIVMKGEKWDEEKKAQVETDEDETVNQASALWAKPKSEITEDRLQGVLQARRPRLSTTRWPGRTPASRARANTPSCSTSRPARRSTCGTATPATASSSTCAASSSWTTPSS